MVRGKGNYGRGKGLAMNHRNVRNVLPYPNETQTSDIEEWSYARHYRNYLTLLAFQLFEWENLPDSIDERYIEMCLHTNGFVGFAFTKQRGLFVSQGSEGHDIDPYRNPTRFYAKESRYSEEFEILSYDDWEENEKRNKAIMIYNNDLKQPSLPSMYMFADELADINQISRVNRRAQKTPNIIRTSEKQYFSVLNAFQQVNENNQAVFLDKDFDLDNFKVFMTTAPYVVDKLRTERNSIWNEVMTFFGVNNANLDKQQRVQSAEVYSNMEQVTASGNIFLKNRKIACERINRFYEKELNDFGNGSINVKLRHDVLREMQMNAQISNKDTTIKED